MLCICVFVLLQIYFKLIYLILFFVKIRELPYNYSLLRGGEQPYAQFYSLPHARWLAWLYTEHDARRYAR